MEIQTNYAFSLDPSHRRKFPNSWVFQIRSDLAREKTGGVTNIKTLWGRDTGTPLHGESGKFRPQILRISYFNAGT